MADRDLQIKIATSQWYSSLAFALFALAIGLMALAIALATINSPNSVPNAIDIVYLSIIPAILGSAFLWYSKHLLRGLH